MSRTAEGRTDAGDAPNERPRVRRLTDPAVILPLLDRDRPYAAAAYTYLEPAHLPHSRWLLAEAGDAWALALLGGGPGGGFVVTLGDAALLPLALDAEQGELHAYVVFRPEHAAAVRHRYALHERQDLMRMAVTRERFRPVDGPARRMRASDVSALNQLYRSESGANFAPYHLNEGVYYGVWEDNRLVSVAGTQMISWTHGTAIVANVLTHPRYRGRGYATVVTSAVTAELLERCRDVVLNVDPTNTPAVRAYARLGYYDAGPVIEAWAYRRRGSLLASIQGFLARVFFGRE